MSALPEFPIQPGADPATPPSASAEPIAPGRDEESVDLHAVPDVEVDPVPIEELSAGDELEALGLVDRAAEVFTPPSFWSERMPSPAEELDRAKRGQHLPPGGPIRTAAVVYGHVAAGGQAVLAAMSWTVRHPARLVTVLAALGLLLASPLGSWVAWVLFGLPHVLFELCT